MVTINVKARKTKLMQRTSYIVDLERCEDWHRNRSPLEFADYYYDFWGLTKLNADHVVEW
jgi:hypothetical protein